MNSATQDKGRKTPRRPFRFGTQDISEATGKSLWSVRKDRQRGKFDPKALLSLSRYVCAQELR